MLLLSLIQKIDIHVGQQRLWFVSLLSLNWDDDDAHVVELQTILRSSCYVQMIQKVNRNRQYEIKISEKKQRG